MLNMIIVDDENIIRESLLHFIDWQSIGVTVIGSAENGSKALDMILENRPDIILSDISMPLLSGIEMIQILREKNINSEIIFISAYSNFDYAKNALQYGAFDYILKPINEKDLLETVKRCRDKILHAREFNNLIQDISMDKQLLLKDALEKLFYGYNPLNHSEQKILSSNGITSSNYNSVIAAGFSFPGSTDISMEDAPILSLKSRYKLYALHTKDNIGILLLFAEELNLFVLEQAFCQYISGLKDYFIQYGIHFAAVSKPYAFSDAFSFIATEILLLLVCRQKEANFKLEKFKEFNTSGRHISEKDILPLAKNAIENNDTGELYNIIISFFTQFIGDNSIYDVDIMKLRCIDFIDTLILELNSYQISNYLGNKHMTAKKNITSQKSIDQLFEVTKNILTNITSLVTENKNKGSNHLVSLTLDYIHENYNKNISLSEISAKLYVSPTYLSMIFSRDVGEPFSKYVLNYRIQVAKKLLQDPKYKIYEIAALTGFSDVAHFSKVFKQVEKKSPKKYLNK